MWLHFKLAKGKWDDEPQLFLKLLRFREMLLWITQVVGKLLGADQCNGIEYEAYQRLTASSHLGPKKYQQIRGLIRAGKKTKEIAAQVGCGESTVRRERQKIGDDNKAGVKK